MKKKVVKLNEYDIEKLVSRVIKEESDFTYNYSSELMQIERPHLGDINKLQGIIGVYESHIKQLRSVISRNSEKN